MIGLSPSTPLPQQRFPTWKQAFVLLGGGLALAASACFGCSFTFQGFDRPTRSTLEGGLTIGFGILVFVGLVMMVSAVVLMLMRVFRALGLKDETQS